MYAPGARIGALLCALVLAGARASAEDLIELPTRAGVTQPFLYAVPGDPRAVAILLPGSDGRLDLASLVDRLQLQSGNFLVRSRRHFLDAGIATVLVSAPSDQSAGMSDPFRLGSDHAADLRAVVADLKRRHPALPVFLVGTSRGTVSAAAGGAALGGDIAGVVLTATVTQAAGGRRVVAPGLSAFDFNRIGARVLLVHHRDDECRVTPYSGARMLAQRYPLVTVLGGDPPRSDPCQALSAHGFLGREEKTVAAIALWMLGKPYPQTIE